MQDTWPLDRALLRNFAGANATSARLCDADLRGTILAGADFTNANLRGADFTEAVLTGANFTGANLREANLTRAVHARATFNGADLRHAIGLTPAQRADFKARGAIVDEPPSYAADLGDSDIDP